MSQFDNVVKRRLSSLYGTSGDLHRQYVFWSAFLGYGRLCAAAQYDGYYELLGKLIRIRVKYPLWYDGDVLIRALQMRFFIIRNRGGGSML